MQPHHVAFGFILSISSSKRIHGPGIEESRHTWLDKLDRVLNSNIRGYERGRYLVKMSGL